MDPAAGKPEAGRTSAEAVLRQSEKLFRAVLENMQDGYFRTDLEGRFVMLSPSTAKMCGYSSPDELIGQPTRILYGEPEERDRVVAEIDKMGFVRDRNGLGRRKDGSTFWVSLNAQQWFDERGRPGGMEGVARDITKRVEAEAALRESEERFRALFETMAVGIVYQGADGKILRLNPAAERILGLSGWEAQGRTSDDPRWQAVHDDGSPFPGETHPAMVALRTGRPVYGVIMGIWNPITESRVWLLVNAIPERNQPGEAAPARVYATFEDITPIRMAEAALRESEERFRVFVDNAPVAIAMFDRDMRYVTTSRRWLSDYGLGGRNLMGRSHYEVFPEIPERWKEAHRRGLAGEMVRAEEDLFERADGSVQWLRWEVRPWLTADGRVGGIVIFTDDITERKRGAEALAISEERYRALFENAAEGILAVDPDSKRFLFLNPALGAMFGYAPGEFEKLTLADIHPKEALVSVDDAFRKLASGAPIMSPVIPCLRRDGTTFVADIRASLVEIGGRRVVFGFFTDVTARVLLEEKLRQSQKMEAVGQLAGGIAHDFNNLLTVISGNADLLLSDIPADDPKRGSLTDIRSAGERAANLTRQLLAFSRKQILEPRLVDLNAAIEGIEKMLRRLIGEDVGLATDLAADPGWVKVDPGQLEQVVMNLAVNARDAMPRGGRITIRTRNVGPADGDELEQTAGGRSCPMVALSISDTGSGIPAEARAHLFEPFFTTKGVGKGTGLGLATVFGIVKQSGGDVTVESEPGKGATFTVLLPSQREPRRHSSGSSAMEAPRGSETILVVEDEDAVRRIVTVALESAGYRVIGARNGTEALEAMRRHEKTIHLMITDVVMPEMSGRDLAERILSEHPGVRILYMSGYTDDAVMRHGIVDSHVAFLQKPFSRLDLTRKVRDVLNGSAQ